MPSLQDILDAFLQNAGFKARVTVATERAPYRFFEETIVELPYSDHSILFIKSARGTFGVWNMLNPESPVAPGIKRNASCDRFRMKSHRDRLDHILHVAVKIVYMLSECDIDGFALQEVPDKQSKYFQFFILALYSMAKDAHINIDLEALIDSYTFTAGSNEPHLNYAGFGTALVIKQGRFTFEKATPSLRSKDGTGVRGSAYYLKDSNGQPLIINNIHGEYDAKSLSLTDYLIEESKKPNTIVCGDTNIPLTNIEALTRIQDTFGLFVEPATNAKDTPHGSRTLDCILSSLPDAEYVCASSQKNHAKSKPPRATSPATHSRRFFNPNIAQLPSRPRAEVEQRRAHSARTGRCCIL